MAAHKAGNLELTAQPAQFSRLEGALPRRLSWFKPLPGLVLSFAFPSLLAAHLFREGLSLVRRGLVNLVNFRVFLKLSCLPSCVDSFLQNGMFQYGEH